MMKVCERCQKGVQFTSSRSHSNVASKRKQRPNLQRVKIGGKRMLLCTSCIRAVTKKAAR